MNISRDARRFSSHSHVNVLCADYRSYRMELAKFHPLPSLRISGVWEEVICPLSDDGLACFHLSCTVGTALVPCCNKAQESSNLVVQ